MKVPRSTIDDALLALLKTITFPASVGATTWKQISKHWQDWSNTSNQPALFLKRVRETATQQMRGENKWCLKYEIWVYAQVDYNTVSADPYNLCVNPIMEAIDKVLQPVDPSDWQNLGNPSIGNVRWSGAADICDGSLDGQVCIVVPVEVYLGV